MEPSSPPQSNPQTQVPSVLMRPQDDSHLLHVPVLLQNNSLKEHVTALEDDLLTQKKMHSTTMAALVQQLRQTEVREKEAKKQSNEERAELMEKMIELETASEATQADPHLAPRLMANIKNQNQELQELQEAAMQMEDEDDSDRVHRLTRSLAVQNQLLCDLQAKMTSFQQEREMAMQAKEAAEAENRFLRESLGQARSNELQNHSDQLRSLQQALVTLQRDRDLAVDAKEAAEAENWLLKQSSTRVSEESSMLLNEQVVQAHLTSLMSDRVSSEELGAMIGWQQQKGTPVDGSMGGATTSTQH